LALVPVDVRKGDREEKCRKSEKKEREAGISNGRINK
jgi:hypothetical protein